MNRCPAKASVTDGGPFSDGFHTGASPASLDRAVTALFHSTRIDLVSVPPIEPLGYPAKTSAEAESLISGGLCADEPPFTLGKAETAGDVALRGLELSNYDLSPLRVGSALHALGNIAGESRPENKILLNGDAEESLRRLMYITASKSSKLTPSGLLVSVLQQDSEIHLAGYRVITGMVARLWFLMEICSKQEIINIVTDASTETTKIGMEARYKCCQSIHKAFVSSSKLLNDPALAGLAAKLQEAVRRGPYLAREHVEAQPVVVTADRF